MKIIILSAGKGERLYPLTKDSPKPLLDLGNGVSILDTQLHSIEKNDITEIVIVIGYKNEKIEDKIRDYQGKGIKIKTIFNPFYDVSNNFISLWLALTEMTEDFIITNGDNIFKPSVLKKLINAGEGIYLTVDKKENYDIDDMKIKIKDKKIIYVSKDIEPSQADGESIGIVKVQGKKYINFFTNAFDEMLRKDTNYRNKFWLETFNYLSKKGHKIGYITVSPRDWKEIDFHIDMEDINRKIKSESVKYVLSKL